MPRCCFTPLLAISRSTAVNTSAGFARRLTIATCRQVSIEDARPSTFQCVTGFPSSMSFQVRSIHWSADSLSPTGDELCQTATANRQF